MLAMLAIIGLARAAAPETTLDDPFVQATHGDAHCPPPARPAITRDEAVAQAHERSERGTSCFLSGRCRLSNSYLYDKEIIPRVVLALNADDAFRTTNVWVLGQRRWVWLKGCVATQEQSAGIEARVREIDDVEAVVNELMVGTSGSPPYDTARSQHRSGARN